MVEHQIRSLLSFSSTVTYSPNTTTNKKPALGGLEKAQALRSFLMPTSDSSPAMMPRSQIGLVGTGVALDGGVPVDGGGVPEGGGTTTNGSLVADAGLVPIMFVAVTKHSYVSPLYIEGTVSEDD